MREKTEERIEREECAKEERDTGRNGEKGEIDRAEYEREEEQRRGEIDRAE